MPTLREITAAHNALAVLVLSGAKTREEVASEFDIAPDLVPTYLLDGVNDLLFGKGSPLMSRPWADEE